jgi:exopolysaccharide biosynthesis polyprenyl glycosylphosphotransferase
MPLLRVSAPVFTGVRRLIKEIIDRVAATLLLIALLPVLLVFGAMIKLTSRGPVCYPQQRIGKDGKPFTMVKFRTMVVGSDARQVRLKLTNDGSGPLFKMRTDPRVTKVGSFLRRYSADELPQLWNVVSGTMSLVGPRPPLPEETMTYGPDVRRRLLVKPGMTGLWQVSGRSDLSWEESVRLDLRYVEDWSLAMDALILWKTIRAVFTGDGAY